MHVGRHIYSNFEFQNFSTFWNSEVLIFWITELLNFWILDLLIFELWIEGSLYFLKIHVKSLNVKPVKEYLIHGGNPPWETRYNSTLSHRGTPPLRDSTLLLRDRVPVSNNMLQTGYRGTLSQRPPPPPHRKGSAVRARPTPRRQLIRSLTQTKKKSCVVPSHPLWGVALYLKKIQKK